MTTTREQTESHHDAGSPAVGHAVGAPRPRVDGPLKVTGTAPYAYEHEVENPCHVWPVLSTIARGRVTGVDSAAAEAVPGVLAVLKPGAAPRLRVKSTPELWVLQDDKVHHRNQIVAGVVAETPEAAREAAELVEVAYAEEQADVELDGDTDDFTTPSKVLGKAGTETKGDVEAGMAGAAVTVEQAYTHGEVFHVQMEPHSAIATWHDVPTLDPRPVRLTIFDSNQGAVYPLGLLLPLLGLLPHQLEIISPYVGGGFGGKAMPHSPLALVILAARAVRGRPVKLAVARQHTFSLVGHRARAEQRIRLGADAEGHLTAVEQVSIQATDRQEGGWVDQSALASRMMYAVDNRHTEHRTVPLDIPPGTWMRAPGDFTGMFAVETAMDELAYATGLDPIELRRRNEPDVDPETGEEFSTRDLLGCLDRGAEIIGWGDRRAPAQRREGEWQLGLGVAAACFPNSHMASLFARITYTGGVYLVQMQAADIGTGAHTVLAQMAADALGVDVEQVRSDIGRTQVPVAMVAGGSAGTYEWGASITAAAEKFRKKFGPTPPEGASVRARAHQPKEASKLSQHAFGAHFADVAVSAVTGETRVRRLVGVYAAGAIINPLTATSQMVGGMTMAMSAALHEESYRDPRFGHVVNADLAGYHVASHADVPAIEVEFLDEFDPSYGPQGAKGIGEIAMVGMPAAIGNAIFNATGRRLRDLPFTPARVLGF